MSSNYLTADNGVSSGVTGITQSAGNDGTLQIRTTTSGGTATTAVTVDNAQNVGVGVTPSAWTSAYKGLDISTVGAIASNSSSFTSYNNFYSGTNSTYKTTGFATAYRQGQDNGQHAWFVAPSGTAGTTVTFTQAMTLDASGNFMIGVTTAGSSGLSGFSFNSPTGSSNVWIGHTTGTASGTAYVGFNYNGSGIGSITQNGTTGVLYNLTSDYRLKNNQESLTGAKDFIMALKPKKWQWWDGSGEGVGFVAHEFMEVAKYSGHGEKDAVDADGKPVYQSIQPSSSEVMANLVSFIQELAAQVTSLQATVETQATTIATLQNKIGA